MDVPSVRRPSPCEAENEDSRKKKRLSGGSSSSDSTQGSSSKEAAAFFGGLLRSYGGPPSSSYKLETGGSSNTATGCFGIRIGSSGNNNNNNITPNKKADDDDDPTAVIAQAMNDLSITEREKALEDMHGVSEMVQETPELIANTLQKMEEYLLKIHHKPAYDLAIAIRADHVRDAKLRLMFLRADRFDPEAAAKRLTKVLDWKLKIFGKEKLCQPIGLNDLNDDARFMVESGLCQVLPERDSRGRVIIITGARYLPRFYRSSIGLLQMNYYFAMTVAEDETNQISGVVSILYGLGQEAPETTQKVPHNQYSTWDSTLLSFCMPLRFEAVHFCSPHTGVHFTLNCIFRASEVFHRARFRVHLGSHIECEYGLLSFGVPSNLLPYTTEGQLKTANHKKWIQRRIVMDHELKRGNQVFSGIELPRPNDVLLGKGRPLQTHPGNRRLLVLAEFYLEEYDQANPDGGRTNVVRKMIQKVLYPSSSSTNDSQNDPTTIRGNRGRFLQRREDQFNSGWWEEVTEEQIMIAKASHALRGIRKRNNIMAGRVRTRPDVST
jgi:hypothetical protein